MTISFMPERLAEPAPNLIEDGPKNAQSLVSVVCELSSRGRRGLPAFTLRCSHALFLALGECGLGGGKLGDRYAIG